MTSPASTDRERVWSRTDLQNNPHTTQDKAGRVRRMFGAIAGSYDLNNRLHSFGRDQAWRRRAVQAADPRATDRVLDVACGTGDLTLGFAALPVAQVVGVDFTPEMLDLARHKMNGSSRALSPVRFESGDAMNLSFDDGSFDVVSIAFGLRNVAEPNRALEEFRRVLRPGGRLIILEFSQPRNPVVRLGNAIYSRYVMPLTASLIARDRTGAYRYLPRSIATFPSGVAMIQAIENVGFESVTQQVLTLGVCSIYRGEVREEPSCG